MLSDEKRAKFFQLLKDSTKDEWLWMSGYLSAMVQPMDTTTSLPAMPAGMTPKMGTTVDSKKIAKTCTIVYGTETGNSKKVATLLVKKLKESGHLTKLKSTETYKSTDLDSEEHLFVIISTLGDGDPPNAAKVFMANLMNRKSKLPNLKFSVLGLGDTAYPLFCKTGEDVDSLLFSLGGTRIQDLGRCDVDFESAALSWIQSLISKLDNSKSPTSLSLNQAVAVKEKSISSKKTIYTAEIISNFVLNDTGATKSTRHIELKSDSLIEYEPGDSAGFIPKNSESEVTKILTMLKVGREERIHYQGETWMAGALLSDKLSIRYLPERVIKKYAEFSGQTITSSRQDLDAILMEYPLGAKFDANKVIELLDPMIPRYYSIASSPKAHGENQVHLTVAEFEIQTKTGLKTGLCSDFLSVFSEGNVVNFFIQKNNSFRLPPPEADLIMIGPGTGIAPFRSFLFEREADSSSGRNWLVFGERNFVSDFYYQAEFLQMMETGVLQRLNTAFSRDTKQKVYVQDRLTENSDEFLNWIENGAYIYVCGAKDPMSVDVEKKLIEILSKRTFATEKSSLDYLRDLEEEGRYKKDVY